MHAPLCGSWKKEQQQQQQKEQAKEKDIKITEYAIIPIGFVIFSFKSLSLCY